MYMYSIHVLNLMSGTGHMCSESQNVYDIMYNYNIIYIHMYMWPLDTNSCNNNVFKHLYLYTMFCPEYVESLEWWLDSNLHLVLFSQYILNTVSVAYYLRGG